MVTLTERGSMIDDISEFDEYPTVPQEGTYWKLINPWEGEEEEVFRVEHIYPEDREVALLELSTGGELYTFIDIFDQNYEEIDESELPLHLLANVGVAYG